MSVPRGVIKDVVIVGAGLAIIWVGLMAVFGTPNPFYVVASGSMVPALEVHDVLIVQGHVPFEDVAIGDIIVFDRPSDHDRVIVHRVESVLGDDPRTLRTKGDANPSWIPGTDFPITDEEYIGKVEHVVPQIGFVTQVIKPPVNYVLIAIVIGIMVAKQLTKKRDEEEAPAGRPGAPGPAGGGDGGAQDAGDGRVSGRPEAGDAPASGDAPGDPGFGGAPPGDDGAGRGRDGRPGP